MADKSQQLVLEALKRAVLDPEGRPLFGSKNAPGLFPSSCLAKKAAQLCKEEGYVRTLRTETRGKTTLEICALTEKGLAHLLHQTSAKEVLEGLVQVLEARQAQLGDLLTSVRQTQTGLEALKTSAEKVLHHVDQRGNTPAGLEGTPGAGNGSQTWPGEVLSHLGRWGDSGALEDCPLPELYRQARQLCAALTIGQFHDGIRRLHERERIYLHPWTGPLYEIPEPPLVLMIGHEIAYYASLRK